MSNTVDMKARPPFRSTAKNIFFAFGYRTFCRETESGTRTDKSNVERCTRDTGPPGPRNANRLGDTRRRGMGNTFSWPAVRGPILSPGAGSVVLCDAEVHQIWILLQNLIFDTIRFT
jgi:hypothetical protein